MERRLSAGRKEQGNNSPLVWASINLPLAVGSSFSISNLSAGCVRRLLLKLSALDKHIALLLQFISSVGGSDFSSGPLAAGIDDPAGSRAAICGRSISDDAHQLVVHQLEIR